MIISYAKYGDLTLRDIDAALENNAQLLIFFLFTSYDSEYQAELRLLSRDIHQLTGDHCAAIVFAPPSPDNRVKADNLNRYANPEEEPRLWRDINNKMTENSYAIADTFSIRRDELPAILFLARDSDRYAYISMHMVSLRDFYQKFRTIIADWTQQNEQAFSLKKNITSLFYKNELLPELADALKSSGKISPADVRKGIQIAKRVARHPGEIETLVDFMKSRDISLHRNGILVNFANIRHHIEIEISKKINESDIQPVIFPIDSILAADRRIKFASFYLKVKTVRNEVSEWLSKLLPFFGASQTSIQIIKDVTVHGNVQQSIERG